MGTGIYYRFLLWKLNNLVFIACLNKYIFIARVTKIKLFLGKCIYLFGYFRNFREYIFAEINYLYSILSKSYTTKRYMNLYRKEDIIFLIKTKKREITSWLNSWKKILHLSITSPLILHHHFRQSISPHLVDPRRMSLSNRFQKPISDCLNSPFTDS